MNPGKFQNYIKKLSGSQREHVKDFALGIMCALIPNEAEESFFAILNDCLDTPPPEGFNPCLKAGEKCLFCGKKLPTDKAEYSGCPFCGRSFVC